MTMIEAEGHANGEIAAVDLGSNSFHLIVARVVDGQVHVIDRLVERVRLGGGLDDQLRLTDEAQLVALACLERFGQRLQNVAPERVRAVGTNTLRQARNGRSFRNKAREKLGHPIEVISGREEARLIYLGVARSLADDAGRRLVVDIGGGSTECIVGERFEPLQRDSLYMGCVSYTSRFFDDGLIGPGRMRAAELAASQELRAIERRYMELGWERAIGASGTINAIDTILRQNGWGGDGVTPKGLRKLRKALISAGSIEASLQLRGLAADRAPVLPGGVAILSAIVSSLGVELMLPSQGALREGLLYDLLGRIRHEDVREQTIRAMCERYHADEVQAERVSDTAAILLRQVAPSWKLDVVVAERLLGWAAYLHEIGTSVAYAGHHKHGAYLVQHSDMAGFSRQDQEMLSVLLLNQRRKLRPQSWEQLGAHAQLARQLVVLLRLAILLCRDRSDQPLPPFALASTESRAHLSFAQGWLDEHPLTRADLEDEAKRLASVGIELVAS